MPIVLTQNAGVLKINGVAVHADLMDVSVTMNNDPVNVTRGNMGHAMYDRGLSNTDWKITIAWTDANRATIMPIISSGNKVTIEYGPEGSMPGAPKHVQLVIIESVQMSQTAEREAVKWEISAKGADAPTVDMYNGGTY
ncbi:MAG: hypothetical protein D6735_01155 [Acidobacteria bacterium]|jgi:hypothetical protein|nr:MAG: hypothetical protein D6735_01155 [Acidobacteriota bacterium]